MSLPLAMLLAVLMGVALGVAGRRLLPAARHLGLAESALVGIFGAILGTGIVFAGFGDQNLRVHRLTVLIAAAAGTAVLMLLAARFLQPKRLTAEELIRAGESAHVEFKSSARYNLHTGTRDEKMELVISKTIAAFANSGGGTLLIGVDDEGHAVGLANDYALVKYPDADRFELWLRDHLTKTIGPAFTASIKVDFPVVDGEEVCRVEVPRAQRPVFVTVGRTDAQMWVRVGNSTRQLPINDALAYASRRWRRL